MYGLTMNYQLTLLAIMRRAATIFGHKPIISYAANAERFSYSYREMLGRARRLALALRALGVQPGERVATLGWNHHRHLEAFWGIPASGAVLHALNLRRQTRVAHRPCRQQRWISPARRMTSIRRRGNLQRAADGLDPVSSTVLVDEGVHFLWWRSSSAWAK